MYHVRVWVIMFDIRFILFVCPIPSSILMISSLTDFTSSTPPKMIKPISFSIVLIIHGIGSLIVIEAIASSSTSSGYEEPCNETLKCNNQSLLGCHSQSKTCLCLKPKQ